VQALLDEQIVGRSEELKERALRRRARSLVATLMTRAARTADEEQAAAEVQKTRAAAVAQAAAKLDRDSGAAAEALARSLEGAAGQWKDDVQVVVTGRERDALARDRVLSRYREGRAIERLAPPLAHALVAMAPDAGVTLAQAAALARPLVRAAAAASEPNAYVDILPALARSAIATLAEHLFALAVPREPPARAAGLLRELGALATTLG
jgi:hypothetical protein